MLLHEPIEDLLERTHKQHVKQIEKDFSKGLFSDG